MYNSNGNRPGDAQGATAIKYVRNTRQIIARVHAIVGGVLFGVGVFIFALSFAFSNNAATLSLAITGGSLALSGIIELAICAGFRSSVRRQQARLERLKAEGHGFQGEIVNIKRQMGMYFMGSFPVHVECSYVNHDGKTCLVRSHSFLHENGGPLGFAEVAEPDYGQYSAWVYVNPHDPRDYAVEVFAAAGGTRADYDYR